MCVAVRAYDVDTEIEYIRKEFNCESGRDNKEILEAEKALKIESNTFYNENFLDYRKHVMPDGSLLLIYKLDPNYEGLNQKQFEVLKDILNGVKKLRAVNQDFSTFGVQKFHGCYYRRKKTMKGFISKNMFSRFYLRVQNYEKYFFQWAYSREQGLVVIRRLLEALDKLLVAGFTTFDFRMPDILVNHLGSEKHPDFEVFFSYTKIKYRAGEDLKPAAVELGKKALKEPFYYHPEFLKSCSLKNCSTKGLGPMNDIWNIGMIAAKAYQIHFDFEKLSGLCPAVFIDSFCVTNVLRQSSSHRDFKDFGFINRFKNFFLFEEPIPVSKIIKILYGY